MYKCLVLYDLGVQYGPLKNVEEDCQLNTHPHAILKSVFEYGHG